MSEPLNIKEIEEDIKQVSDIAAIADSKGGKMLVDSLISDVIGTINKLCDSYAGMTEKEFVAHISFIKTNIDMARAISRSKSNKEYLEGLLADALKS